MAVGMNRSPSGRESTSHNRAGKARVLLCAAALGLLLVSSAEGQVLEAQILLPDSLGPLIGNNHIVFDEDSDHPRIFIGGEGGDVIVADAITCERVARIRTGPLRALCYVPAHNKLYVSTVDFRGVAVVDCSQYEVISWLPFNSLVMGLSYNPTMDRVYCASGPMKEIDCASDKIVDSVMVNASHARFALDGNRNKLYVSAVDSLWVVDCGINSVVATIHGLRGAQAMCFQSGAGKVYVAAGESLFALRTDSDEIVYRHEFDTLYAQLACDPIHNRVYYTYWSHLIALDCANDSILWNYHLWGRALSLAPVPELNKLYVMLIALGSTFKYVLDGSTGQELVSFPLTIEDSLYYSQSTGRVFVSRYENAVTAIDALGDTLIDVVPVGAYMAHIGSLVADTVDNRLYFFTQYQMYESRVGTIDCSTNKVKSYSRLLGRPDCLAYNSRDAKLYFSADTSIYVFDCRGDTLVNEIRTDDIPRELAWYAGLNKLYAVSNFRDSVLRLHVVDCSRDTTTKVLDLGLTMSSSLLLTPEFDLLWLFGDGYRVLDCTNDSIVEDTAFGWGRAVSYTPAERKIYAATHGLLVIDTDSRLPIDSIPASGGNDWSRQVYCARRAGKAYWTTEIVRGPPWEVMDSVVVLDTRNDSVVAGLVVPDFSYGVCEDHTGNYVYFASDWLVAVDTRTDSVVSGTQLPLRTEFLVANRATNRLYIAGLYDSVIQVVYDSVVFAGVQVQSGLAIQAVRPQTLFGRGAPLRSPTDAVLFDASGRSVASLKAGANDVNHLSPGVYFVREVQPVTRRGLQAVRKVVIAK